jgi:hypothetical protein
MRPKRVCLHHDLAIERHHATLAVLEVALQAGVQALHDAHPELDCDEEPSPYDDQTPTDLQLAEVLVATSQALLQTLRCYRTVSDLNIEF